MFSSTPKKENEDIGDKVEEHDMVKYAVFGLSDAYQSVKVSTFILLIVLLPRYQVQLQAVRLVLDPLSMANQQAM
jgi:hypothetical protein